MAIIAKGSTPEPMRLLAPLGVTKFRALWASQFASQLGTWMQTLGIGWLISSLSSSPVLITLAQSANTLPFLLFLLPAGHLADRYDKLRIIVWMNLVMMGGGLVLFLAVYWSIFGPVELLVVVFLIRSANALFTPAWHAHLSLLVPKKDVPAVAVLNSMSFNVARAMGALFGGTFVAGLGKSSVFLANALSYVAVILVAAGHNRKRRPGTLNPARQPVASIRDLLKLQGYKSLLVVAGLTFFGGSSGPALLPYFNKAVFDNDPRMLGALMTVMGVAAILGSVVCQPLTGAVSRENAVCLSLVSTAAGLVVLGCALTAPMAIVSMMLFGFGWSIVIPLLQGFAQTIPPEQFRGRSTAVFFVLFYGGSGFGSPVWGAATIYSLKLALMASAGVVVVALLVQVLHRIVRE